MPRRRRPTGPTATSSGPSRADCKAEAADRADCKAEAADRASCKAEAADRADCKAEAADRADCASLRGRNELSGDQTTLTGDDPVIARCAYKSGSTQDRQGDRWLGTDRRRKPTLDDNANEEQLRKALPDMVIRLLVQHRPPLGPMGRHSSMSSADLQAMHRTIDQLVRDTGRRPGEIVSVKFGWVEAIDGQHDLICEDDTASRLRQRLPITAVEQSQPGDVPLVVSSAASMRHQGIAAAVGVESPECRPRKLGVGFSRRHSPFLSDHN